MDEDTLKAVGCFWAICLVAYIVWSSIVGGQWRTEVEYISANENSVTNITVVKKTIRADHWIGGLIKGKPINVSSELNLGNSTENKLVSFKIQTRLTMLNLLLTGVTLGIYSPNTVSIEAKIGQF